VVAFLALLRLRRQLLHTQLADRQQHTPSPDAPQERHGGHRQGPGHAGDREPEALDGDGPDAARATGTGRRPVRTSRWR